MLNRNTSIHSKTRFFHSISVDTCKMRLHHIFYSFLSLVTSILHLIHQIELVCPAEVINKVQRLIEGTRIAHLLKMNHLSPQLAMFSHQIHKIDDILNHFPFLIFGGQLEIRTRCFLCPIDCEVMIDPNLNLVPSIDPYITAEVPIILSFMPKMPCFLKRSLNPLNAVFRITSACLDSIDLISPNL